MIATNIISGILQRYKQICAKYPQSPSFIPNTNGDSFYLVRKRDGNRPVQVRISNHGTYLNTWCDREELGNSVERLDPSLCENISIVFIDDCNDITKDCEGRQDCEDCNIQPCIPQTFDGQNELGKPFKVIQYTYKSSQISPRYINGLAKAIAEASVNGKYNDPLGNLVRAAKTKPLSSSINNQGIKENRNMNKKQTIRLNESQFNNLVTKIVKESVKKVLKESTEDDEYWNEPQTMSRKDAFALNGHRNNLSDLTPIVMNACKTLSNINFENPQQAQYAVKQVQQSLMNGLQKFGFTGHQDGSGTQWRNDFKPMYNQVNGYDGNVEPKYGRY